ncbi:hypothetical protein M409DRAFT_61236 [Zasmidium cellare ATCC 36951]|uniref:BZIP domain-containing protein n=1 Tax=Zasmidium cellare ATCC 36951 TaxID=1080233 RepID=A0A6A6BYG5_ZASCE|nr:uncharacterized protein M409DRAFT_61236 [Zasmidium cellare ATCC 36951]KAF2158970.1 hypothetical protein M409DRAFT_61236 [Zasmidium cellare ATCC 36951]
MVPKQRRRVSKAVSRLRCSYGNDVKQRSGTAYIAQLEMRVRQLQAELRTSESSQSGRLLSVPDADIPADRFTDSPSDIVTDSRHVSTSGARELLAAQPSPMDVSPFPGDPGDSFEVSGAESPVAGSGLSPMDGSYIAFDENDDGVPFVSDDHFVPGSDAPVLPGESNIWSPGVGLIMDEEADLGTLSLSFEDASSRNGSCYSGTWSSSTLTQLALPSAELTSEQMPAFPTFVANGFYSPHQFEPPVENPGHLTRFETLELLQPLGSQSSQSPEEGLLAHTSLSPHENAGVRPYVSYTSKSCTTPEAILGAKQTLPRDPHRSDDDKSDDNDPTLKRRATVLVRERNRLVATKCRSKKRVAHDQLASVAREMEFQNRSLTEEVIQLRPERVRLLELALRHDAAAVDCTFGPVLSACASSRFEKSSTWEGNSECTSAPNNNLLEFATYAFPHH